MRFFWQVRAAQCLFVWVFVLKFCLSLFCVLCLKFIYIVKRHRIAPWRVHFAVHARHVILRPRCIQSHNISRATAETFTFREPLSLVRSMLLIVFGFCVMLWIFSLFVFVLRLVCPTLPVSGLSILFSLTFIYHVPERTDLNTQCNT